MKKSNCQALREGCEVGAYKAEALLLSRSLLSEWFESVLSGHDAALWSSGPDADCVYRYV